MNWTVRIFSFNVQCIIPSWHDDIIFNLPASDQAVWQVDPANTKNRLKHGHAALITFKYSELVLSPHLQSFHPWWWLAESILNPVREMQNLARFPLPMKYITYIYIYLHIYNFNIPFGQKGSRTSEVGCIKRGPSAPFWFEQWGVSTAQAHKIWAALSRWRNGLLETLEYKIN